MKTWCSVAGHSHNELYASTGSASPEPVEGAEASNGSTLHVAKNGSDDVGKELPEVTADFSGAPRPMGSGFDIGTYEYSADAQTNVYWLPVLTRGF